MICKFQFFKYVASVLKYLLVAFQTNKPMLPFLATAVEKLYRKCLTLFMKRDVVDGCPTSSLLKLDLEKEEYQHPVVRVDLGSAVACMLKKSSLINDVKNKFRKECVMLLVNMLKKIKERSPLKHCLSAMQLHLTLLKW